MTVLPPSLPPAAPLLAWYDRHRRALPFRSPAGGRPEPYHVWLSEVMLQQTTVAAVGPRFDRFLARFPTVQALAAAGEGAVMEEWAGLGYYARARNLHACARLVAERGGFPRDAAALRDLPGIGAYTAAAVAAIAFGEAVVPVDGNVERVVARLAAEEGALPAAKPRLAALATGFMADPAARARPGDFAQALFDLGATICTPRAPACALCPWREGCAARRAGIQETLPRKAPKRARPLRHGVHFLLTDAAGQVLLRRRPPKGLLGGMLELPGTPWRDAPWTEAEALAFAPAEGLRWRRVPGVARHGFTHFELEMLLLAAAMPALAPPAGMEARPLVAAAAAMPTVMRKLLDLAAGGAAAEA
ncbi:A/G-specific adenine glycosylase [Paracraurococcus ruber]|uniref:Adenine DNA glycosylase n=1 Tax=Paracraurococcus ruber TaxID=77675 RepID=A0ABS1D4Q4_9PROT|nr:A/G-specific adenine glycosylase [Paracraurococcus ruber]MBK1661473.1 A/G-specific adenine glycosylase [Paracraurococcus ruber]TDG21328.1 A/G-specific adenine glycosylase [Paracraurococcus ruber]